MPLPPKLQERIDDLNLLEDRAERIQALIDIADEYDKAAAIEVPRQPQTKVPGCESEVYVTASKQGGFRPLYAVDNPQGISAMALAAILAEGLTGASIQEIDGVPEDLVYAIFGKELSMGKSLGLTGMVRMTKHAAHLLEAS